LRSPLTTNDRTLRLERCSTHRAREIPESERTNEQERRVGTRTVMGDEGEKRKKKDQITARSA
jgi:hypothetical protein